MTIKVGLFDLSLATHRRVDTQAKYRIERGRVYLYAGGRWIFMCWLKNCPCKNKLESL